MIEIVNVVASGALDLELDLERLADDIGEPTAHYNPDEYPGMYLRFEGDAPLITVYRTGKFIITGADSKEESKSLRERFLNLFSEMDVIEAPEDKWYSVQNYVCTAELGLSLNLNTLAIGLGLEKTEYEPEQFPGLVYRPPDASCVILLFGSGRVVITGSSDIAEVESAFDDLCKTIQGLQE